MPRCRASRTICSTSAPICARPALIAELKDRPGESVGAEVLKYVNRLSDFLFVAGRYANGKGARDVLSQPGQNR